MKPLPPKVVLLLAALATSNAAWPVRAETNAVPSIAMLWSPAKGEGKPLDKWSRYSVIVVWPDEIGLEWEPHKYPDMAEKFRPESIPDARAFLGQLKQRNPAARVLMDLYYFEANVPDYPPDGPWWYRDEHGKTVEFWKGCRNMAIDNPDYIAHVVRRVEAVVQATDRQAGIFLDNLRFEPWEKAAWTNLLGQVRARCGNIPILVNAGWGSDDLDWVAPFINGIMYEDSVEHTADKDPEKFYGRVQSHWTKLREPRLSVNEAFGKRSDAQKMRRELVRTLVYTDAVFLYSDSTDGHNHNWWPEWNLPLGAALDVPQTPSPGKLAQRTFANGLVAWLPSDAKTPADVKLKQAMRLWGTGQPVSAITLTPGQGALLVR